LGEEHRLRVFENRVLRKILNLNGRKTDHGKDCIIMSFIAFILPLILSG
jgi:hypothetical protein